jgi:hypothetical protein
MSLDLKLFRFLYDFCFASKNAFSFEDPDLARATGREDKSRLAIVKNRLRAKLEAKKAAGKKN